MVNSSAPILSGILYNWGMQFTLESIRDHVGAVSFQRGRQYFTSGRVIHLEMYENEIHGHVLGSQAAHYEVDLSIDQDGEIADSDCSCPVDYACKHVAAVGLKALMQLSQQPSSVKKQSQPHKSQLTAQWTTALTALINNQEKQAAAPFQLQILLAFEKNWKYQGEMFEQMLSMRFGGRKHKIGSQRKQQATEPLWDITIRPRLFNPATGHFSISKIKWNDAAYNSTIYWDYIDGKLSEQHYAYLQLLSAGIDRYGSGWERIKDDKASFLWKLLQEHEAYGVSLLGGEKGQYPLVMSKTPLVVGLIIEDSDEGVLLHKTITLEGKPIEQKTVAFAGDPPVFAVVYEKEQYVLHPVPTQLPKEQLAQASLVIPKTDIPLLQQEFLPKLARQVTVSTHTNAITLPETVDPTPLLSVQRKGKAAISVRAGMTYEGKTYFFSSIPEYETIQGKTVLFKKENVQKAREVFDRFIPNLNDEKPFFLEGIDAARFVVETIPQLQEQLPNLIVQKGEDLPDYTFDVSEAEVSYSVDESDESNDWFDLQVTVKIGKEDVPFQELFAALAQGQEYILLASGKYFLLNTMQFTRLRQLIAEAKSFQEKDTEGIRLTRFQAGLWDELQQTGIVDKQAKRWQDAMQGLLSLKQVGLQQIPKSVNATLREYQQEGYSWMYFLREHGLGGILADDMGLGKTIQAIAFMAKARLDKGNLPFLVVAPTSVVENWDVELAKFAPKLTRVILRAGDRSVALSAISKTDVVVISYPLLVRDFEQLKKYHFDTIIFDEAQMVKNYQSKAYGLARKLKTHTKIALTGTPMENNLMELWTITSLVAPGLFPTPEKFTEHYRTPIEKYQDKEKLQQLRRRIRPFILRRQKSLVAKQLPPKNEQVLRLELNAQHKHLYEKQLQYERKRVLGLLETGGLKEHRFEVLRSLMRLRQMCLHPVLLDEKYAKISATKLEALLERIEELVAEGHRVLIFSQFTSFLRLVRQMLEINNYKYLYLAGETKKRGELIRRFNEETAIPIFLISLKAGGFGLNLTAADYCILLDPWWNPAVEQQAIDRTHRIGQTKPVFVYKMIAKDTIEEKVLALQEKKRKLFQNVLDEEGVFGSLITEDDIKGIFSE